MEVEAKKTKLAEAGHEPQEAGLSSVSLSTADVVDQLKRDAKELANVSREVLNELSGEEALPADHDLAYPVLAGRLEMLPDRVLRLQESAARAGAEWTLSLLLSWYPDADLKLFEDSFRGEDTYEKCRRLPGVRHAACTIADFVDFSDFIPDRPASDGELAALEVETLALRAQCGGSGKGGAEGTGESSTPGDQARPTA